MQGTVLLLNASFEPLGLISRRRAIVLVLDAKAEVVEEDEILVRSESTRMRAPLVVRLLRYVKVPYRRRAALNLRSLLARDGNTCQYCLKHIAKGQASIDHVHPRSKGGEHSWENVVAACKPCNSRKGDRLLSELGWTLPRKPFAPKDTVWLVVGVARVEPAWQEYLSYAAA